MLAQGWGAQAAVARIDNHYYEYLLPKTDLPWKMLAARNSINHENELVRTLPLS